MMDKLAILLIPIFLLAGLAQIAIGVAGIDYHLGGFWAFAAVVCAFGFRFLLPVTIGSYFGAVDVFGWPWWVGLGIAVPGLLFVIPGIIGAGIDAMQRK